MGSMEEELGEAIALYETNLAAIKDTLQVGGDEPDPEMGQLQADLEQALTDAQAALADITTSKSLHQYPEADGHFIEQSLASGRSRRPNNAKIHPRSRYATEEPDFAALAQTHPSLQPFLIAPKAVGGRPCLDFTNPSACRQLTQVLLKNDFGIEWWVPDGQLVPPLTNRANYIHWLEDLLALSSPTDAGKADSIKGLDIGCGANLIYPILGAVLCGWHFVGVDVTDVALEWAAKNLEANPQLQQLITLRRVQMQPTQKAFLAAQHIQNPNNTAVSSKLEDDEPGGILSGAITPGERFSFCMCNPPFFESIAEAGRNPTTAFAGTHEEMVYPGGELAFVTGMVEDSVKLQGAIHWYTTMVGKKATMKAIRGLLYRLGAQVVRTTEFFQGKTSRWGIAWSWVADAAVINKPLQRYGEFKPETEQQRNMQQKQQGLVGSKTRTDTKRSMQVRAPAAAAMAVLTSIADVLREQGFECAVDQAAYTIQAEFTPGQLLGAGNTEQVAKRAKHDDDTTRTAPRLSYQFSVEVKLLAQNGGLFGLTAVLGIKGVAPPPAALTTFHLGIDAVQHMLGSKWRVVV